MATVQQIIGKINPKLYASNADDLLKEYKTIDKIPEDKVKPQAVKFIRDYPNFKLTSKGPEATYKIIYDSSSETLEPIYFFLLDLIQGYGFEIEKLVDNFTSSPGSGHFAELGARATRMQDEGMKILGTLNTVLRSVLNIIYDLKEFRMRLEHYDNLTSKDKDVRDAARLSLKQVWMDKVDIAKGNSSIKAMALGQAGFQTLIDAFLFSETEKDIQKLDLNDRVIRILKPRVQEFNIWINQSEKELRKRYDLEKIYLKGQVNSLRLYSRWVKPYLESATQLESGSLGRNPEIVKTFNTILLELTLFGKQKINTKDSAISGDLPVELAKDSFQKSLKRQYYSCIVLNFKFRGIPQRISQQSHYVFGGRAEVTFSAYSLNDDELKAMNKVLDKSEFSETLKLVEGATTESLTELEEEISFFLEDKEKEKEKEKKKSANGINPFLAIVGYYNDDSKVAKTGKFEKGKGKDSKVIKIESDNFIEKNYIRPLAASRAEDSCFTFFDIYKKAHSMQSWT